MKTCKRQRHGLSGDLRNVRILATLEMSAVGTLSLLPLERFASGMVLGWTILLLDAILRRVVGRRGLRRSATPAPADRLYARRPGLLSRGLPFVLLPGVGRRSVKRRGSGGGTPRTATHRHFAVGQLLIPKADRHTPVQTLLDHHPTAALTGRRRRQQLIEAILEAHCVVIGHHPLLLNTQNRRQVVALR
jgi:hypothetical protein